MKKFRDIVSSTLLVIGLVINTGQFFFPFPAPIKTDLSDSLALITPAAQEPCTSKFDGQDIPDDGTG